MSAAGIIAHCLGPSGPAPEEVLVWWAAGDGVVNKVRGDNTFPETYSLGASDITQAITVDVARNRVFVPTDNDLLVFEDATANGAIPAPTVVSLPDLGTHGSWVYIKAVSLDPDTGQLFLANGSADSVSIVDTDNSVQVVSGIDQAFNVMALGEGKFGVISNNINTQVYGPSNAYASALVDSQFLDAGVGSAVYDPDNDKIICYLDADEGGLRLVDATTGAATFTAIDNHYGTVMYRVPDTGYVVINQTADNGKLWVYNPITGAMICSINYSGEEVGSTISGAPTDIRSIGNTLLVVQRWSFMGDSYNVAYLFDLTTGDMLDYFSLTGESPGLGYISAADPVSGSFAIAADTSLSSINTILSDSPYTFGGVSLATTGANTTAYSYSPET